MGCCLVCKHTGQDRSGYEKYICTPYAPPCYEEGLEYQCIKVVL